MANVKKALKKAKEEILEQESTRSSRISDLRAASVEPCCFHCGSDQLDLSGTFHSLDNDYRVYRCDVCGLSQLDGHLSDEEILTLDDENHLYESPEKDDVEAAVEAHSFIVDLLEEHAKGKHLLEIGCSHGYKLAAARKAGWEVEGVELSPKACRFARDVLKLEIHEGTIETYLPDHTFDSIVVWHVFEHTRSIVSFLAHAHLFLNDRGKLLIQVPSYSRYREQTPWELHPDCFTPIHNWYFTRRSLTQQLRECGFEPKFTLDDERTSHLTMVAERR